MKKIYRWLAGVSFWINVSLFAQFVMWPLGVWHPLVLATFNVIGPSTEYHNPSIATATPCNQGGDRPCIYVGDEFYVWITVVRHRLNGSCTFVITRYAEHVDGPRKGVRHPISYATLQFVGHNEMRTVRWPSPPDRYIVGYEVDENNVPQKERPLLTNGLDEEEFLFFVVGRYYCNYLDDIFPRYIQGSQRPNETAPVRAILRRHR